MKKLNFILLWALLVLPFAIMAQGGKPIPNVTLNNGVKMPILGFGTFSLYGEVAEKSVEDAISLGYRLFDTATAYGNEEFVGKGIKKSGIDREELFITTKLWVSDSGYENTKKAFNLSLKKLGVDYIDLYLIHRPRGDIKGSWKAMEELYESGKIRAIGVSNFDEKQLKELLEYAKIKPAVNQIEAHPFFQQYKEQKVLQNTGIQMEAWSPFAGGRNDIFVNPVIASIAEKYSKTNAQVVLRWLIQREIVTIPRTSNKEYMQENLNVFDFELNEMDMKRIATLDLNITQFPEWE